jgi:threonine dehydrogenase-like Zn-dependent dehydrogenase
VVGAVGTQESTMQAINSTRPGGHLGFDLTLSLEEAAEGYKAMDERRATKVLLTF